MNGIGKARKALMTRILAGHGASSPELRRTPFDRAAIAEPLRRLIDKVTQYSSKVSDRDVAAARALGLSEEQIFEMVVCVAIGAAAKRRDDSAALPRRDAPELEHDAA